MRYLGGVDELFLMDMIDIAFRCHRVPLQKTDYRREAMDKPLRILRLPIVEDRTGLKRDSIYRGARQGWFPKPVKISEHASGMDRA